MTPLQPAPVTQYSALVQREGLREGGELPFFRLFSGPEIFSASCLSRCRLLLAISALTYVSPGLAEGKSRHSDETPPHPSFPSSAISAERGPGGRAEIVRNYEAELCPCTVNAFSGSACVRMQAKYF